MAIVLVLGVVTAAVAGTAAGVVLAPLTCGCPEVGGANWVRTTPAYATPTASGFAYTFTITEVVTPPETFGEFSFWFTTAMGTNVAPQPGWTVTVHASAGNFTAGILSASQRLSAGGSVPVTNGAVVSVFTGPIPLNGGRILLESGGGQSTVVVN